MRKKTLTERQKRLLEYICRRRIEMTLMPSVRELSNVHLLSDTTIRRELRALHNSGYIYLYEDVKPMKYALARLPFVAYGHIRGLPLQVYPKGTATMKGDV